MTQLDFWLLMSQMWGAASMMPNSPWRCLGCVLMSVLWFIAYAGRASGLL